MQHIAYKHTKEIVSRDGTLGVETIRATLVQCTAIKTRREIKQSFEYHLKCIIQELLSPFTSCVLNVLSVLHFRQMKPVRGFFFLLIILTAYLG